MTTRSRGDIEGLRAVAALSVAAYHIWSDRISGGVDVFLVVSGFLITGMLVRQLRGATFSYLVYVLRIARRIVPPALLVVATTAIAAVLWLPRVSFSDTFRDLQASALYVSNIRFAREAVDYNASDFDRSPALHFWALSLQGQLYLIMPFALVGGVWLARRLGRSAHAGAAVALGGIAVLSFARAITMLGDQQAAAYFDTAARAWQFALGGLLAIFVASASTPRIPASVGWAGVAVILVAPLVVDLGASAPGPVTLIPVCGALLILAAGSARPDRNGGAERLLGSRPLVAIGGVSYGLYLWHWPVYLIWTGGSTTTSPSLAVGTTIIGLSLALAWATNVLIERPMDRRRTLTSGPKRPSRAELTGVTVVLGLVFALPSIVLHDPPSQAAMSASHPGAAVLADPTLRLLASDSIVPALHEARDDRAAVRRGVCVATSRMPQGSELLTCELGAEAGAHRVAIVGASHAAQWIAAFEIVAPELDITIVPMIKTGRCGFSVPPPEDANDDCRAWLDLVLAELERAPPHAVFTTATVTSADGEFVPDGYLEAWRRLDALDIPVVAIRDNPRLPFDPPTCVERHGPTSDECSVDRYATLDPGGLDALLPDTPANVRLVDLTDQLCGPERCQSVVGQVLVYRDDHHISDTYVRTIAPALREELLRTALFGPPD